jgi:hypothetical protein
MEIYKASLDTTSKIITAIVFLMAVTGITMCFFKNDWYTGLILGFIPSILIVFTFIFKVQSYQITDDKLIIKRPVSIFNREILLSDIASVRLLNKQDFKGTIRTGGVGGLFGYYGYFSNIRLGNFTMYATNGKNRVLLVVGKYKSEIVISPDDAAMADDLQKRLKEDVERLLTK